MGIIHKLKHKVKKHKPKPQINLPHIPYSFDDHIIQPIDDHIIEPIDDKIIKPIENKIIQPIHEKIMEAVSTNTFDEKQEKKHKPIVEKTMIPYWLLGGALISTLLIIM